MVHRQLTGACLAALLLVPAGSARAANAKIAIGNFQWSRPQVEVSLGEHVTWYWAGPDLQHSVTGNSANDAGDDSDPGRDVPLHRIGDKFQITFTTPGTYAFHCKLHPTVAGTIVVDPLPGDPVTEPDPDPVLTPDRTRPSLRGVRTRQQGRNLVVRYTLDKASSISAELRRHGRLVRSQLLQGHVGYDTARIDVSRLKAGRYTLALRPTDALGNVGPVARHVVRLSTSSPR